MYKDKRGLWRESVTINGIRKTFSGKTKKDVVLKMASFRIEALKPVTFSDAADGWEEANWDRLRFGSYRTYLPCLRRALERFGSRDLNSIKTKEVQAWIRELGTRYAYKTVYNHKCVLSQIFDYAIVEMNQDIPNPCDRVKMPAGLKKGARGALSDEERQVIRETSPEDFQLAFLILYTGCRCGEALALRMSDVDMERNVISIHSAVSHHGNQPVIGPPKTEKSVRTVPLLPQLKERLTELKLKKTDFIVSGEKPLTKSALDKRWKKWCKEKGVSIDRHQIRHQYATTLYEAGVDPKTAQVLLGHAQISTTMDIYTHLSDEKRLADYMRLATYVSQ